MNRLQALRWLPALTASAYVLTVAVMSPGLIHNLFWDPDVAAPFVLAERLRGHGPVYIPHFGQFTLLWSLLATRNLPAHRELWEAIGYPFAVAAALLVGWATARVAGRWAGVTAAAAALVAGPFALRSQLSAVYHVTTPFTAAVLGAYLVVLGRRRAGWAAIALAVAAGLLAGTNAVSDPLLWPAGIAPFAVAAAVLLAATRRTEIALQAGVALASAVVSAVATLTVMHGLGYHVVALGLRVAHPGDLPANARQLGRMVALLAGANYALPEGYPGEPLRILIALFAVAAAAAALYVGVRYVSRRTEPILRAYACFWAAAIVLLGLTVVGTNNAVELGAGSGNYVLTFPLAAAAGIALLAAGSRRTQVLVALAVTIVGATNIAGIVEGRADTSRGAIGRVEPSLVRFLEQKGVTHGYAGYWDSHNLTWQSGMRLLAAPVAPCGSTLCPFTYTTITSWYEEQSEPSFLIVDPTNGFVSSAPRFTRQAASSRRLGPLTVYVFDYDIARHLGPPQH